MHRDVYNIMNAHVTASRRPARPHTARLAAFITVSAALTAWFLSSVAQFSERAVVLTVMVIAFCASWVVTNQRPAPVRTHRVTVVRVPARTR